MRHSGLSNYCHNSLILSEHNVVIKSPLLELHSAVNMPPIAYFLWASTDNYVHQTMRAQISSDGLYVLGLEIFHRMEKTPLAPCRMKQMSCWPISIAKDDSTFVLLDLDACQEMALPYDYRKPHVRDRTVREASCREEELLSFHSSSTAF